MCESVRTLMMHFFCSAVVRQRYGEGRFDRGERVIVYCIHIGWIHLPFRMLFEWALGTLGFQTFAVQKQIDPNHV